MVTFIISLWLESCTSFHVEKEAKLFIIFKLQCSCHLLINMQCVGLKRCSGERSGIVDYHHNYSCYIILHSSENTMGYYKAIQVIMWSATVIITSVFSLYLHVGPSYKPSPTFLRYVKGIQKRPWALIWPQLHVLPSCLELFLGRIL